MYVNRNLRGKIAQINNGNASATVLFAPFLPPNKHIYILESNERRLDNHLFAQTPHVALYLLLFVYVYDDLVPKHTTTAPIVFVVRSAFANHRC